MKMYTTPDQTAKLIELGLIPKHIQEVSDTGKLLLECLGFSVGELIEMLPSHIGEWELNIWHDWHFERWVMCFDPEKYTSAATELIDAAYDLIVKLKEDGVI